MARTIFSPLLLVLCISTLTAHAQSSEHGLGIQFSVSSLGLGGQAAVALSNRVNLRGGYNDFSYGRTFTRDGLNYDGKLKLRSAEALVDFFPWAGSFHISPGALICNGNRFDATLNVPAGQTFDLGDATYRSNPADPIRGGGKMTVNQAAPMVLVGWGNLVPRAKHLTTTFEAGVAFHGTPKAELAFTGSVCDVSGANCRGTTDPQFQSSVKSEQDKLNSDASAFKVWPVLRFGIGYRF